MALKVYKTALLESYRKSRELMDRHWQEVVTAREQGRMLVAGYIDMPTTLLAGFDDYAFHVTQGYAVNVAINRQYCIEGLDALEARGYARDICGYFKGDGGCIYLDRYLFGGRFPRPDLFIGYNNCDASAKWGQVYADQFGTPLLMLDWPHGPHREDTEHWVEYMVSQFHDVIERVGKITGKNYDDEKLIEGVYHHFRIRKLFSEVMALNAHVPAPLDARMITNFLAIPFWRQHHPETVELIQMLRDEVEDRIEKGTAAVPVEQCRLMLDIMPPWPSIGLLRAVQREYGAIWVGIYIYAVEIGMWELQDGALVPAKDLEEQGVLLKNREDAIRALARFYAMDRWRRGAWWVRYRLADIVTLAKMWRVDGVTLHFNRGCAGICCQGIGEAKMALREAGIPTMGFEANFMDPRENNPAEIKDSIDRFMDMLGVKRLGD